ncbi:DUF7224 domain-containing protein [Kitasatospora sp. CB01950]|uniref:DUF7224 domain-containing protein n=1 Tax=Kitasatospora sp. CB01950 TaxID=1703930 RepID=UPI00093B5956|nr:hypothetical protein [Kitasatospora sp. CB01950]OKJ08187.1 hypothetical protein AMK19_19320 [Kitasatospora sp. CB01950]
MRWRTLLRTSIALRVAPALFVWVLAYVGNVNAWVVEGYWASVTAQSSFLLGFTAPACAACAAWEGARVRASRVLDGAPVRSAAALAVRRTAPVLAMGLLAVLLPLAVLAPDAAGSPGGPTLSILGIELLVVAAHTALGYAAGQALPTLLAVPLVTVTSFVWMAYPASLNTLWVRQLNGHNLSECCALDQQVSYRALAASAVVAVGAIAAAALWLAGSAWLLRTAAVAAVAGALAVGSVLAVPLGFKASVARDESLLRCDSGRPQVCLWPEQRASADDIRAWVDQAHAQLAAAGVQGADRLTLLPPRPSRGEVLDAVARSAVPHGLPECAERGAWPGSRAVGPVYAWLSVSAGLRPQELNGRYRPDDVQLVSRLVQAPADSQLAWFRRNVETLTACDRTPDLDPGHYLAAAAPGRG